MSKELTPPPGYKARVRLVRGSALEHLRQLRSERLARRLPETVPAAIPARAGVAEPALAISRATADLLGDPGPLAEAEAAMAEPVGTDAEDISPPAPSHTESAMPEASGHLVAEGSPLAETVPVSPDEAEAAVDPIALPSTEATLTEEDAVPSAEQATAPLTVPPVLQSAAQPEPEHEVQSVALAADPGSEPEITALPASVPTDELPMTSPEEETAAIPQLDHSGEVEAFAASAPALLPEPAGPGNDLDRLPGAGQGLIWLLGQCGITCLDDLAHADPVRLEAELGLVGRLLDLPAWIAIAKAESNRAAA